MVRCWDDGEVAAVVEKRCGASLVAGKATATSLALRRLLWTKAEVKEEAGKCKWEHRASRADAGEIEGALWLGVAWLVRATAMHGFISSMWRPASMASQP